MYESSKTSIVGIVSIVFHIEFEQIGKIFLNRHLVEQHDADNKTAVADRGVYGKTGCNGVEGHVSKH